MIVESETKGQTYNRDALEQVNDDLEREALEHALHRIGSMGVDLHRCAEGVSYQKHGENTLG